MNSIFLFKKKVYLFLVNNIFNYIYTLFSYKENKRNIAPLNSFILVGPIKDKKKKLKIISSSTYENTPKGAFKKKKKKKYD